MDYGFKGCVRMDCGCKGVLKGCVRVDYGCKGCVSMDCGCKGVLKGCARVDCGCKGVLVWTVDVRVC